MKHFRLLFALLFLTTAAMAQGEFDQKTLEEKEKMLEDAQTQLDDVQAKIDDLKKQIAEMKPVKDWKFGGYIGLLANQTALVNWAAGGENSISGTFIGGAYANFARGKHSFENNLDITVGYIKQGSSIFQKNEDLLSVNSKYGYDLGKNLFLTTMLNFNTLMFVTEDYNDDSPGFANLSMFAAPAFLKLGVGIDYKPNKMFSLYASPATGKFTFVQEAKDIDETRYGLKAGDVVRAEFGASLQAKFEKEIVKNVNFNSNIQLFNNFTDPNKPNRKNIDVNWRTQVTFNINDWLSTSLFIHLIYDNDIKTPVFDEDGNPVPLVNPDTGNPYLDGDGNAIQKKGPRTQLRQTFGLSLIYRGSSHD
jgi:hypothetical protein